MAELRLTGLIEVLAQQGFSARLEGEDSLVRAVNTLEEAGPGELTFLSNPKYASALAHTQAAAVVLREDVPLPERVSGLRCADPYAAITVAIVAIHGHRRHPRWGVSERATIHPEARIGANANIAAGVTIAAGVEIGANCTIYPGCYIADGAQLGDDCTLYPNVVVYDCSVLGDRVTIHAGSVIGEDGLGYAPVGEQWLKIPQVGRVIIEDDVEIGANCAIDRATLGRTQIGTGTKFGNVVVIGHGTKVGSHCLFVGHVGVAGSVTIGRHVTLAGQVGVAGHLEIGDNATVAAQSGVSGSVPVGAVYFGSPATEMEAAKRSVIAVQKLPAALKRLKQLEREVEELRRRLDET